MGEGRGGAAQSEKRSGAKESGVGIGGRGASSLLPARLQHRGRAQAYIKVPKGSSKWCREALLPTETESMPAAPVAAAARRATAPPLSRCPWRSTSSTSRRASPAARVEGRVVDVSRDSGAVPAVAPVVRLVAGAKASTMATACGRGAGWWGWARPTGEEGGRARKGGVEEE